MSRRKRYSPEAHVRYRRSLQSALRFGVLWLGALSAIFASSYLLIQHSDAFVWIAAVSGAVLIFSLVVAIVRLVDFASPNLMPYFNAKVPGIGLCVGHKLLKHSRTLDGLAESIGVRRIGSFVSDDDLLDRSGPTWHPASDALATFDGLLERFGTHPSVQAARSDLEHIRDRLRLAVEKDIQFCLLLRDLHATNAMEWGLRKGHY